MLKNIVKYLPKLCENYSNNTLIHKRLAGHSKWQNIRHIKGAKDAERADVFLRLGRQIKVAVQEGGGSIDPKVNSNLSSVIEQTKRANMPTSTLQSILKSCQQDKSQGKGYILEIKGPGGCMMLCEMFTNHLHQLKMNLATILRKHQSKLSDGGGAHLFEQKGIIEVEVQIENRSKEEIIDIATEHAIESGAEDVTLIEDNILEFTCGKSNFNQVVHSLERLNYKVVSASVEYIPFKVLTLQESDKATYEKLCSKLQSLPEFIRMSDNVA